MDQSSEVKTAHHGPVMRKFKAEDWPEIVRWFDSRKILPPQPEYLSNYGFVVSEGKVLFACGFIFPTSSGFCLFDWVQTNPTAPVFTRALYLRFLLRSLRGLAKELGFKTAIGFVPEKNRALLRFYQSEGARVGKDRYFMVATPTGDRPTQSTEEDKNNGV